jgi:hypothetical protein
MQFPKLDEETKKEANALTIEEIGMWVSPVYNKEILHSGIDGVAIAYLMKKAGDISSGKITREEFVKKYDIDFEKHEFGFITPLEKIKCDIDFEKNDYGLTVPLNKIESEGIFIPEQAYWNSRRQKTNRDVWVFDARYRERLLWSRSPNDFKYLMHAWDRKLTPEDLADPILSGQVVEFGKIILHSSVDKYNKNYKDTMQPKNVTAVAEKLIEYYLNVMNAIENSK